MGGGGSKATSKTDIITESISNIISRNIMNCSSSAMRTQSVVITGNRNIVKGIKMINYNKLTEDCSINQSLLDTLKSKVASELEDKLKAESEGALSALGQSASEKIASIKNSVQRNITQEQVSNIIRKTNDEQVLRINGDDNIVSDISMEMTAEIMSKSSQALASSIASDLGLDSKSSTDASASNTPLKNLFDGISNVISSVGWVMFVYIFIFIAVIYVVITGIGKLIPSVGPEVVMSPYIAQQPLQQPLQQQPLQ